MNHGRAAHEAAVFTASCGWRGDSRWTDEQRRDARTSVEADGRVADRWSEDRTSGRGLCRKCRRGGQRREASTLTHQFTEG